jgi:hypothetical protein
MNQSLFIALFLLLASCNNNSQESQTSTSADSVAQAESIVSPEEYESQTNDDTTTIISFNEFNISISRLVVYDEHRILNKVQKDTVYLFPELGETIEGQIIKIDNLNLEDFKIEQRYETSISIQNEGPHCDLTNWKHYTSPWKEIPKLNNQTYQCLVYEHEDYQKFPEVSVADLKNHVKANYDKEWHDLISGISSIRDYPSSVGISRYFIRISGIDKDTKALVTKMLIFENPMGC